MSTQPVGRITQLTHSPGPTFFVRGSWLPAELRARVESYNPGSHLGKLIRDLLLTHRLPATEVAELLDSITRTVIIESSLALSVIRHPDSRFFRGDLVEAYGIVSRRVVTDTGVGFIVDAFANSVELENMKYHGLGTGSTAEAQTQTALVTELTTEYTGNVRATGTTAEGATANIFQTVATNTLDSGTPALREHAVFSQAATGGGVMLDRSLYSAINLDGTAGDSLQSTYEFTATAGG